MLLTQTLREGSREGVKLERDLYRPKVYGEALQWNSHLDRHQVTHNGSELQMKRRLERSLLLNVGFREHQSAKEQKFKDVFRSESKNMLWKVLTNEIYLRINS